MRAIFITNSLALAFCLLVLNPPSFGQSWENRLQDGSRIRVDPTTNRALVVTPRGARTQLWDGVHRLHDGSEITVRSGVVVPKKEIIELRKAVPRPETKQQEAGGFVCEQLVKNVCGPNDECRTAAGCEQAYQLLQFEKEERKDAIPGFEQAPTQCREALGMIEFFQPCVVVRTACHQLVDKSCGPSNQCRERAACDAARQLLEMENEERVTGLERGSTHATTRQCEEALSDGAFFVDCVDP